MIAAWGVDELVVLDPEGGFEVDPDEPCVALVEVEPLRVEDRLRFVSIDLGAARIAVASSRRAWPGLGRSRQSKQAITFGPNAAPPGLDLGGWVPPPRPEPDPGTRVDTAATRRGPWPRHGLTWWVDSLKSQEVIHQPVRCAGSSLNWRSAERATGVFSRLARDPPGAGPPGPDRVTRTHIAHLREQQARSSLGTYDLTSCRVGLGVGSSAIRRDYHNITSRVMRTMAQLPSSISALCDKQRGPFQLNDSPRRRPGRSDRW